MECTFVWSGSVTEGTRAGSLVPGRYEWMNISVGRAIVAECALVMPSEAEYVGRGVSAGSRYEALACEEGERAPMAAHGPLRA